ncbi:indole-3-acetic acid-amido synthetase GH3.17-like [Hibiscus syriacus]|uniref:indole-3-acetic acid-amido synthetase GH3.17-like n=1 Tax=Hibiscus syriacus TaxID=106335 RepID=UPI001924B8C8|nr:indole-3-acetic acid-amido synthetase GH3.17-like [Hibiscus syriacus]
MAEYSYEFEDGMKMIEEITPSKHEEILGQILHRNAGTEYLSRYLNGKTDKTHFKSNVPIVAYEDIKPYIDRIASGETLNILSADPVVEFYRRRESFYSDLFFFSLQVFHPLIILIQSRLFCSSGTSGEKPKLIPVTAEILNLRHNPFTATLVTLTKKVKRLELIFTKPDTETPCGLKASSLSTSLYKEDGFRNIISQHHTSPFEAIFCSDPKQSMYCHLLAGLIRRDEVRIISAAFSAALLRAIKFIEDYWTELCFNIRSGQLRDWITDSGCRNAIPSTMEPNPKSAESIQNICSCKSWEGIIRKLWPNAKCISAISTGVMS